ncbi:hypothetical protein [Acinetobacter sp. SH20PTE14]|uniref:hypothetical protein n=1 Tax=Acinetobacter sp. SH20PTE14 TaxID=2905879 RepID=UPI001F220A0B|nr:hypothetical protein [Acinetobacter sp. SH20PTE14]UIJ76914.1 hypothetical protein LXF01_06610 [Acinetobacter sp. SH20PTE14]UIJ76977.1 hypothetical protein LXF01_06940 [Acinetobacter sp. SH20PTE14]
MENPEKIEIEGLRTINKLCKFGADHNMEGCTFTEIVERMFDELAKAQAVPEGFVLVPIQPNEKTLIKMSWSVALGEDQHGNSVYLSIDEAKQAYEAVIEAQEQD